MENRGSFDPILLMNLLSEFIERFNNNREYSLQGKIEELIKEFEVNSNSLSEEDLCTLGAVKNSYEESLKKKAETYREDNVLRVSQRDRLIKSFKKYRGLVFDIKTRFDYSGPHVAIQDGLDITEYLKEVIEEVNNDLKESHLFSLSKERREHGEKVLSNLSIIYTTFNRERMREVFPLMVETLKSYDELVNSED